MLLKVVQNPSLLSTKVRLLSHFLARLSSSTFPVKEGPIPWWTNRRICRWDSFRRIDMDQLIEYLSKV